MFEQDIFLSYGWSGNQRDEGAVAWVETLRKRLQIALRTPLGRTPNIFWDGATERTGALPETLERAITRSRLFLFVVSPASCQSKWCPWEIHRFLEHARCAPVRNEVLLPEDRLFGVTLEPVAPEALPQPLQPLILRPYDLTQPIPERDTVEPVDWDHLAAVPRAAAEFSRLHTDLATRLKTLQDHERSQVERTGVRIFLGVAPSPAYEHQHLRPLRRLLLMDGHRVLRGSPAPRETEDEYRLRLSSSLARTDFSIHVLSAPVKPDGWLQTAGLHQLQTGKQARFLLEDAISPADPTELAVNLTERDQKFDKKQPWEDLPEAVLKRATQLSAAHKARRAQGKKSVVIACCDEDLHYVAAIMDRLEKKAGFSVQTALGPGPKQGNRNRINRELFREFDGVLVYYSGRGNGQDEWLHATCLTARKAFQEAPRPVRRAGLILHPPPPPNQHVRQIPFERLPRATETDFGAIDQWAASL